MALSSEIRASYSLPAANQHAQGLVVTAPHTGDAIASLALDSTSSLSQKITAASAAQKKWAALSRPAREVVIRRYSDALKAQREALAALIHEEAGKITKEGLVEADGSADVLTKTIADATLAEFGSMVRRKERPPVGVVGLITSFNFPLVVAHWTLAPALLAGNAVIWKPSEKTPLVAFAAKVIFDQAFGEYKDLLQLAIGGRDVGEALVAHEQVDMISATGSVAMGEGIERTLASKRNNAVAPILELGGNNGVIISERATAEHVTFATASIMNSFLGTTGQRCTNTRRVIAHCSQLDALVAQLGAHIEQFMKAALSAQGFDAQNAYGYGPLIDADAYQRFEQAKQKVIAQGGKIIGGKRLLEQVTPQGYYVEPALAVLPAQSDIMQHETFAPILFITSYAGGIEEATALVNAPANSGLVGGIYTQSQKEADYFAQHCEAGHVLINSPKGTGTPAFGMGFGGNKASGRGEILNSVDPLQAFTRAGKFTRIAQNKDIALND
ncbi:MAG: aldehyde dehydrogenase family protein [Rickettsiales bacterium]|nr:aldehyde dehydrogenase family protein [Rickettsiales bacterium]